MDRGESERVRAQIAGLYVQLLELTKRFGKPSSPELNSLAPRTTRLCESAEAILKLMAPDEDVS